MDHTALYYAIVTEENRDELSLIIAEHLDLIGYKLVNFNINRADGFPYICCQIKTAELFSAQMIGFFVAIDSMIAGYEKPHYYLPIVVFCADYDERFKRLINQQLAIEHEIQHIKDMLDLIKQNPDYPEKSYRYGINSALSIEDLPTSIDLELFKLFAIEPNAMRLDFDKGEKSILMPFDGAAKTVIRYDCDSVDEYIGLNIKSYIENIKDGYKQRFKNDAAVAKIVDQEVELALNRYGKTVFGQKPLVGLHELQKRAAPKFFLAMARRQFV